MHLSAIRSRPCCALTPGRSLVANHYRLLSNHSAASRVDDHSYPTESVLSWEKYHAKEVGRRPVDTKGVIIGDLEGTLENQRACNRAKIIRSIVAPSRTFHPIYRLRIDGLGPVDRKNSLVPAKTHTLDGSIRSDGGYLDGHRHTGEGFEKAPATLSADSMQPKGRISQEWRKKTFMKKAPSNRWKTHPESSKVLEYEGRPSEPVSSWKLKKSSIPSLQRPWLPYCRTARSNSLSRSVSDL